MNYFIIPGMKEHPVLKIGKKSPDYVIREITKYFGVDMQDLKRKNRKRRVVDARFIIMYYLYDECNLTLNEIVDIFTPAVTHHTTVLHGIALVRQQKDMEDSTIFNMCKNIVI